ncbi:hypothetical protein Tco_0712907 [Tanacetum coccineum]
MNPATIRAQAQKMAEYEAKRKKDLKTLGFSEWLEVHALAFKSKGKSIDLLLQSLIAKFQWVLTQTKALGISLPPELSTFEVSIDARKRKRSSEIPHEVFVKENVVVDGMHRNIIPPQGSLKGRQKGLVIRSQIRDLLSIITLT